MEVAGRAGEVRVSAVPGNPLRRLAILGRSLWLDDIRRAWLADGLMQDQPRDCLTNRR